MSGGNAHTLLRAVFLNLLIRQLISLYRESVSRSLHQIPPVSLLIHLSGCGQRTPPGYLSSLDRGGIAPKPHKSVHVETSPKQVCAGLLKFLLKSKTLFAFGYKMEALFLEPSNTQELSVICQARCN